jgi:uncharacterized protein YjiS (DUF1127 family)
MPTMTTAQAVHGRSLASDLATSLREALTQRLTYRRTLAELRALPDRMLRDLGFTRAELKTIARRETYGH